MANLGDFGKFRLILWRDENPSTVNKISVAVSQTDYTGVQFGCRAGYEESPCEILGGF